jgi:pyruvate dehydrogenase E1 component alpha subunit
MSDLSKDQLLEMYHTMVLIRRFEETSKELYHDGSIGGAYLHLYTGQEATGVGALSALRTTDDVITSYRDHGIALARGIDPNRLMAEMFGKRTGISGGKGGSMHLADPSKHMWGGYGIVGGHLPIAAGIALKIKYQREDGLVLCMFGDGASNNGYFHEAVNFSAVMKLPMIWLVENNLYGMGTSVEQSTGQPEIVKRAVAYGIKEGPRVDGMNIFAVYNAIEEAAEYARKNGPIMIESLTYRFDGHGMSDKMYQSRAEEMKAYHEKDPINRLRNYLCEIFKDIGPTLEATDQQVEQTVKDAVEFARTSPVPTYDDLINNVYA